MASKSVIITRKQESILRCILAGEINKQIAPKVNLTKSGLGWEIGQLYRRLGVRDRIELFLLFGKFEMKVRYKLNKKAPKLVLVDDSAFGGDSRRKGHPQR